VNAFQVLGGQLSELAAQLAKVTQPGHFNGDSRQGKSGSRDLVAKDEQRFPDTDQHVSPGEYPRFNSANSWIVYG